MTPPRVDTHDIQTSELSDVDPAAYNTIETTNAITPTAIANKGVCPKANKDLTAISTFSFPRVVVVVVVVGKTTA